jgi:hypothetical protein
MSPTVKRVGPYRFFFYGNEGFEPPHIHVRRDKRLAKFWLGGIELASSTGFRPHELFEIQRIIEDSATEFEEAWHEFFGT